MFKKLCPSPAIHNRGWQDDAYGNTTASTETFENHHAYTGAYMDDETGLYYLSSRYYDPKTGSFTSADSYRGESEGYWQLYAYCEGDPVNGTDLSGHARRKPKQNIARIFYDDTNFSKQANGLKRALLKMGYKVKSFALKSAKHFKYRWNMMPNKDIYNMIKATGFPHRIKHSHTATY